MCMLVYHQSWEPALKPLEAAADFRKPQQRRGRSARSVQNSVAVQSHL